MGIDIYMHWKDQTEEEHKAQLTGFSVTSGNVGYLREAYHGSPYATKFLMPEAFDDRREHTCFCLDGDAECEPCKGVAIPASLLRERLPGVVEVVVMREKTVYGNDDETDPLTWPVVRSFIDFVELAERKEEETGEPVRVYASY